MSKNFKFSKSSIPEKIKLNILFTKSSFYDTKLSRNIKKQYGLE